MQHISVSFLFLRFGSQFLEIKTDFITVDILLVPGSFTNYKRFPRHYHLMYVFFFLLSNTVSPFYFYCIMFKKNHWKSDFFLNFLITITWFVSL